MYTLLLELAKRHFKSEGFKKRFNHIYLPVLKMGGAWIWNLYFRHKEKQIYTEVYKTAVPVIDEMNIGAPSKKTVSSATLPRYEDIADRLKKFFIESESQGSTSQCVAFTFTNIHRLIAKLLGFGEIKVSQLDIYLDRVNKQYDGDGSGMSPQDTYLKLTEKGVAIGNTLPLIDDQSVMNGLDNRKYFPDAKVAPFRIKMLKEGQYVNPDWGYVMSAIQSVPMGYPLQAILGATDTYFGSDVVYAKYNTFYAGHSVTIIGGSACIVDGQEGFFITDSAYYKGRVYRFGTAIRFITKDFWNKLGYSVLKPIFVDAIQNQVKDVTPTQTTGIFVYDKCGFGENNHAVTILQKALINLGYSIPAGATGQYGAQTATAVLKFQLDKQNIFASINPIYTVEFFKKLAGKNFGDDSIAVINRIQGL